MAALLAHPIAQSALVPVVGAAVAAGLIRALGGRSRGAMLAGAAIALAFLLSYAATLGLPLLPPRAAVQKLFPLVVAGLALGSLLDLVRVPRRVVLASLVPFVALGLGWIGGPRLAAGPIGEPVLVLSLTLVGSVVVLARLERRADDGPTPSVLLLVAALGTGGVAVAGASASLGQLAFALAASVGGFMLWNWPRSRFPFGRAALFGGGATLTFLAGQAVFFTDASRVALAVLVAVFFADGPVRRLMPGRGAAGRALRPVVVGLVALVPAAAAVAWAMLGGGGDDPYR